MASTPKLLFFFLFLFAHFSIQIHAREFFSKIPRENTNEKESTVSVPYKEEQQKPRFSPETQNGFVLYGHEAETNTKETYEPYVTPAKFHPIEPYNMIPASKNSNNNNNKDSYFYSKSAEKSTEKENLDETRFTEKRWSTKENQNNNYYNGNNEETMFTEKGWSTNYNNNNYYYYNGEKQGMRNTRFLNGKYYYDIGKENPQDTNQNSRRFASRNGSNKNRYNNKRRYNQNQEENEEKFEP